MIAHSNIEKSLYKFLYEQLSVPYGYAISYGAVNFDTNAYDTWFSVIVEELGAGAKKFSQVRLDIFTRLEVTSFNTDEITAIDRVRTALTNANIPLYDFSSGSPVLVDEEKILIKNREGRFTVERVVLDNLRQEYLQFNLRRSSIFFRVELLTDTVGGRFV